jgi:hypothetical protein
MSRPSAFCAKTRTLVATALFGATVIAGAGIAYANTSHKGGFDGTWSVLIVTEAGSCDRAYRYPVRISNGSVGYAGQAGGFTVSGRVGGNGAVTVRVSRGSQYAQGNGRLSGSSGQGTWRGGDCSGYWTAEKR